MWAGVARAVFVLRATSLGVPWQALVGGHTSRMSSYLCAYERIRRPLSYPEYFAQPFHAYRRGNLDWQAACEVEASTLAMSATYWPGLRPTDAAARIRRAFTRGIRTHRQVADVVDVGCSTGLSTAALARRFPEARLVGVDMCPHFLSIAECTMGDRARFVHANAEDLPLPDDCADVVGLSYVMHEVPDEAAAAIARECRRILRPGGVRACVDFDARKYGERGMLSKKIFAATEPHFGEVLERNLVHTMFDAGFEHVELRENDPVALALYAR